MQGQFFTRTRSVDEDVVQDVLLLLDEGDDLVDAGREEVQRRHDRPVGPKAGECRNDGQQHLVAYSYCNPVPTVIVFLFYKHPKLFSSRILTMTMFSTQNLPDNILWFVALLTSGARNI